MPAATAARAAENVEVLHWWTSGGEAAALDVLKKDLESKGITWTDMPVAGGGGAVAEGGGAAGGVAAGGGAVAAGAAVVLPEAVVRAAVPVV